jgi:hypothetical protein
VHDTCTRAESEERRQRLRSRPVVPTQPGSARAGRSLTPPRQAYMSCTAALPRRADAAAAAGAAPGQGGAWGFEAFLLVRPRLAMAGDGSGRCRSGACVTGPTSPGPHACHALRLPPVLPPASRARTESRVPGILGSMLQEQALHQRRGRAHRWSRRSAQDEPFRWSLAKIWGLAGGAPLRYTLITERVAPVDPAQRVDLGRHAMPPLRERCGAPAVTSAVSAGAACRLGDVQGRLAPPAARASGALVRVTRGRMRSPDRGRGESVIGVSAFQRGGMQLRAAGTARCPRAGPTLGAARRLDADPAAWLPGPARDWTGTAHALAFDEQGYAVRVEPAAVPWAAPEPAPPYR